VIDAVASAVRSTAADAPGAIICARRFWRRRCRRRQSRAR
jgi:hypothetical protein